MGGSAPQTPRIIMGVYPLHNDGSLPPDPPHNDGSLPQTPRIIMGAINPPSGGLGGRAPHNI